MHKNVTEGLRSRSGPFLALSVLALVWLNGQAQAAPLDTLLAGGTLSCGPVTFSGFRNFSPFATGGADAPTAAEINITVNNCNPANNQFGLLLQSAKWNVDPGQTMDTALTYDISGAPFLTGALALSSFSTDGDSAIHITETLFAPGNLFVDDLQVDSLLGPFVDTHTLNPTRSFLTINKDISLEGHSGQASLSTLTQDFTAVPEPASMALLMAGLVGVAALRRRSR